MGKDDSSDLAKQKKKSKKKKRLPKNYNPNVDPDPERWLPRRERTGLKYMPGYKKPRKDKRKGEKFTGAQGSDQGKSENFDYSNRSPGPRRLLPSKQVQHQKQRRVLDFRRVQEANNRRRRKEEETNFNQRISSLIMLAIETRDVMDLL